MTPLEAAIGIAKSAYKRQRPLDATRSADPHPLAVLRILREATMTLPVDVYVAGVLHDVTEGVESLEELRAWFNAIDRLFGGNVAAMVQALAKDPAYAAYPPEVREYRYLDRLARNADDYPGILFIAVADRIDALNNIEERGLEDRIHSLNETREIFCPFFIRLAHKIPKDMERAYFLLVRDLRLLAACPQLNS